MDIEIFKNHGEIPRGYSGKCYVMSSKATFHYSNGVAHCSDAPAIIWDKGDERWYYHGKLHRLDGPAVIDYETSKMGNNPIVLRMDYYINNTFYNEKDYKNHPEVIKFAYQKKLKLILETSVV